MVLSQIGWAPFFCERLFKCNIDLASAVAGACLRDQMEDIPDFNFAEI